MEHVSLSNSPDLDGGFSGGRGIVYEEDVENFTINEGSERLAKVTSRGRTTKEKFSPLSGGRMEGIERENCQARDSATESMEEANRSLIFSQLSAGAGSQTMNGDSACDQDENYTNLFVYFLDTFQLVKQGNESGREEAVLGEGNLTSIVDEDDDEVGSPTEGDKINTLYPESVGKSYYKRLMYRLLLDSHRRRTLHVSLSHVENWHIEHARYRNAGRKLAEHIRRNFVRIHEKLQPMFQKMMDQMASEYNFPHLSYFLQLDDHLRLVYSIRDLRCQMAGKLIAIRGQVTRTSDVRPELLSGQFICLECRNIKRNVTQHFKYTTPLRCSYPDCTNISSWELQLEHSSFGDWQKIRVQEAASDSSAGSMPRAIDVILRHDLVDSVNAGDRVFISGSLVAIPELPSLLKPGDVPKSVSRQMRSRQDLGMAAQPLSGLMSLGVRDLSYRLVFLASSVEALAPSVKDTVVSEDKESYQSAEILECASLDWVRAIATDRNTLTILARSVAPRVWGHDEIKKGILLMITGGVPKNTGNAKLRGDINMCIVGDPSTAKSQLLKFVEQFAPRAILASGKSSTAAGLTAAVHRDPDQGDNVLEAGALMYADQGICCIDEFDKMDEKDRAAIHEAMEQQTISITKAGIQATLNARASVFAACNPRFGRYDHSKTLQQNVNIPPPLLSRFDLIFTMIDEAHRDVDEAVAMHLKLKPVMTDEAKAHLVEYYVALRMNDAQPGSYNSVRITVRQLESLIRLSEAVARLKISDFVDVTHVREACSIFKASLQRISGQGDVQLTTADSAVEGESGTSNITARHSGVVDPSSGVPVTASVSQTAPLRISREDYDQISYQIVDYINQQEREIGEDQFQGVRSQDLIDWWLLQILKPSDSRELDEWNEKLQLIITRLIDRDGVLLGETISDDHDGAKLLRVHPNMSDISSFEPGHAIHSYGHRSFSSPSRGDPVVGGEFDTLDFDLPTDYDPYGVRGANDTMDD